MKTWRAQEEQVLSYLMSSVSRDVLVQVALLPSASDVWKYIEMSYASHSHARVINTLMALATTHKGSMTTVEYVSKMKSLADDMASAGKKLDVEELSSYILASLDSEYNSLVSSIVVRVVPISFGELYSQLLSFETRLELQSQGTGGSFQSSANNVMCGRGVFTRGRGGRGSHGGGSNTGGHGCGDSSYNVWNKFPPCQLCGKTNHAMFKCYKRFDPTFMGEEKSANTVNSYGVDSNWYTDSGATYHVTGDLEKLAVREPYNGNDQIYTVSGSGMNIEHIGKFVIPTPYRDLDLHRVLYVPHASKNLGSIHRITSDNNVFFELHPEFFLIKDQESRKTILHGRSCGGLYPLPCSSANHIKQAYNVSKVPQSRWHACLGHPSSNIVKVVLSNNSLPYSIDSSQNLVCDTCQQAKC
jgi:hypothetical protein